MRQLQSALALKRKFAHMQPMYDRTLKDSCPYLLERQERLYLLLPLFFHKYFLLFAILF